MSPKLSALSAVCTARTPALGGMLCPNIQTLTTESMNHLCFLNPGPYDDGMGPDIPRCLVALHTPKRLCTRDTNPNPEPTLL